MAEITQIFLKDFQDTQASMRHHLSDVPSGATPGMAGENLPLGVAGPGADDAFLAAEFVALAGGFIQRTRNMRLDRIAMGTAGVGHVNRQRGAGTFHRDRLAVAVALLERGGARRIFARIVVSLPVSAAFADGKGARRPAFRGETRSPDRQSEGKNKQRATLRGSGRYDQNPLPQSKRAET